MKHRKAHSDGGIATQARLVGGAIEVNQRPVKRGLIVRIPPGQSAGDVAIDVRHRALHIQTAQFGAAITQINRLTRAARSPSRRNAAPDAAIGKRDLSLDRRPAA